MKSPLVSAFCPATVLEDSSESRFVENARRHTAAAAIDEYRSSTFHEPAAVGTFIIRREPPVKIPRSLVRLIDDHLKVTCVVLRARRVDELTEPAHVEANATEVLRGWTVDATHCQLSIVEP
jgi:hypothetical protein